MKYLLLLAFLATFSFTKVNGDDICTVMYKMRGAMDNNTFNPNISLDTMCCILNNVPDQDFSYAAIRADIHGNKKYGIFQIAAGTYCGIDKIGGKCNANCKDFTDDSKIDDLTCVEIIFKDRKYRYWPEYAKHCINIAAGYYDRTCLI